MTTITISESKKIISETNINNIILSEGKNQENEIFLESEMLINTSFLSAEMEIFSIKKETIIEVLNNKIPRNNNHIMKDVSNLLSLVSVLQLSNIFHLNDERELLAGVKITPLCARL